MFWVKLPSKLGVFVSTIKLLETLIVKIVKQAEEIVRNSCTVNFLHFLVENYKFCHFDKVFLTR